MSSTGAYNSRSFLSSYSKIGSGVESLSIETQALCILSDLTYRKLKKDKEICRLPKLSEIKDILNKSSDLPENIRDDFNEVMLERYVNLNSESQEDELYYDTYYLVKLSANIFASKKFLAEVPATYPYSLSQFIAAKTPKVVPEYIDKAIELLEKEDAANKYNNELKSSIKINFIYFYVNNPKLTRLFKSDS